VQQIFQGAGKPTRIAHMRPVHLIGLDAEVVGAGCRESSECRIDVGLAGDEGREGRLVGGVLGAAVWAVVLGIGGARARRRREGLRPVPRQLPGQIR
jgi:hypothetical protein